MSVISDNINKIKGALPANITLVAVSKTKPIEILREAYDAGQRIFGENKVQEMCDKYEALPKDIEWHLIGHLQTNKVKYVAPFVSLIHAVESEKLLKEISKQAVKAERIVDILIQIHIAKEETKFGMSLEEAREFFQKIDMKKDYPNVKIKGLMTMASFTDNVNQVTKEFEEVAELYNDLKNQKSKENVEMKVLSMGMSGDYLLAIKSGSNMIRVGSSIFGSR